QAGHEAPAAGAGPPQTGTAEGAASPPSAAPSTHQEEPATQAPPPPPSSAESRGDFARTEALSRPAAHSRETPGGSPPDQTLPLPGDNGDNHATRAIGEAPSQLPGANIPETIVQPPSLPGQALPSTPE